MIDESCQPAGAPRPLAPSFEGGSVDNHAGAFSPFVIRIGHPDADQPITGISLHLPPGLAAMLSSVSPCPEPASPAEPWQCGAASDRSCHDGRRARGTSRRVGGTAYLTSGYDGAPFGLLVQTRAQVGPFDLGIVNVRSRIDVNPSTAAVTVTTDPGRRTGTGGDALPTMIKGIPAQIKAITVAVDRPEFEFNPTNCSRWRSTASSAARKARRRRFTAPSRRPTARRSGSRRRSPRRRTGRRAGPTASE